MNQSDVKRITEQRSAMLRTIVHDISPSLYAALEKKMEYERSSLLSLIELDAKIAAAKKELNKTLKSEYFIQKTLDISHI